MIFLVILFFKPVIGVDTMVVTLTQLKQAF
jgi:hypothetical protein